MCTRQTNGKGICKGRSGRIKLKLLLIIGVVMLFCFWLNRSLNEKHYQVNELIREIEEIDGHLEYIKEFNEKTVSVTSPIESRIKSGQMNQLDRAYLEIKKGQDDSIKRSLERRARLVEELRTMGYDYKNQPRR